MLGLGWVAWENLDGQSKISLFYTQIRDKPFSRQKSIYSEGLTLAVRVSTPAWHVKVNTTVMAFNLLDI